MSNIDNIETQIKSSPELNCLCKNDNIKIPLEDKLKLNQPNFHSYNGINEKVKNPNEVLSELLDNLNKNSLNIFYRESSSIFKKKIDDLNLKFYLETEKYLSNQCKQEKTESSLFIILFKQIKTYIEEIERLNLIILEKKYEPRNTIERTDEILKKQKDFEINQQLIKTLKDSKSYTESKLLKTLLNEDKLKKENEKLKQENEYLKRQFNISNIDNKNMIKTLTQSNFYSKTFSNFIHNERGISDITKACSNLSCENTIDNLLNKKRNNSENNNFSSSYSIGFNNYNHLINHSYEPKKSIGIIKCAKEKIKNEKKVCFDGLNYKKSNFENINISSFNNMRPNQIMISNNNRIKESDLISEFNNLDFSSNNHNNKPRTEIIISNLEDYYNNNKSNLNRENLKVNTKIRNSSLESLNSNNNINTINVSGKHSNNYGNNFYTNNNQKSVLNNKKIIQKKIPVVKMKINK